MTARSGRKRILVVDDDRGMVNTLADILELRGWEAVRAFDGVTAISLVEQQEVDAVLMDIQMPRLNGVHALKRIKSRRAGVRVVLMTAFATEELVTEGVRDGAVAIVRKPIDLPELFALLDPPSDA